MTAPKRRKDVRNIAIIAHVDHGKTTLVDGLLRQTGVNTANKEGIVERVMDSDDLERERGITIFSKNASFEYRGVKINLVDTPGHADFGSEVERILKMVDGVLLLVDAAEGPMPQTKFVLKKSLELHLKPIVVINKVDRAVARPNLVVDETFDLFCELNASDEQLDFPIVFASGKEGWAKLDPEETSADLKPLLETILHRVLPPLADRESPLQMLVTMLDYDDYVGRLATGRIMNGKLRVKETVAVVKTTETGPVVSRGSITKILAYRGLKREEILEAEAGDIICVAGLAEVHVGDTIADHENPVALPPIKIDEPTISMNFGANSSPLAGQDGGKFLTSRHLRERLLHEAMVNVGIRVEPNEKGDQFKVSGRGELHLSILIETMRREGYELEVSRPEVIFKKDGSGKTLEPAEELVIEVPSEYQGAVMEELGSRKADMKNMVNHGESVRLEYQISSRALMGFRNKFLTMTRGTGVMYHLFLEYQEFKGEIPERQVGVQISQSAGKSVAYALWGLQERGELFIGPGVDLYEGMIIGVNNKGPDLVVNATKEKKLTNMRASGSDEAIMLTPPREMTLETALEFIGPDELVEATPKNIRLRKRFLSEIDRKRAVGRGRPMS